MTFLLIEPDKLMWPGKLGLIANAEDGRLISFDDFANFSAKSSRLFMIPSGRSNEQPTLIFSSQKNLGRVEVVLQHGHIWPLNPPLGGREIMEELVVHLNSMKNES